jgi:IrrE N-terminal-like domain
MMVANRDVETAILRAVLHDVPAPPVDLFDLASRLAVQEIRPTQLSDGYTDFRSSRPVIFLNHTVSRSRMRFIFAHELAHVVLRTRRARVTLQELGEMRLLENEEHLADCIALAILVPDTWVDALRAATYTLDGLQRVAAAAEVSLAALVQRMTAAGITVGLLHWLRGDRDWYVVDRPGTPSCLHGDLRLADESHAAFDRLSTREVRTSMRAYSEGRAVESTGIASRTGREVLYLIDRTWYPRVGHWYSETTSTTGPSPYRISQFSSIDPRA